MFQNQQIVEYYDQAEIAYKDVWHLNSCKALHYGFWIKGINDLKSALVKENELVARIAGINSGDYVLDAGCGIGGSSIFLAQQIGCRVVGITLSEKQCNTAKSLTKNMNLENLAKFEVMDYHKTSFLDNTFDVVWFMESMGYSDKLGLLLSEMNRILKPGGRIIIADGFALKENMSKDETAVMENWLHNWAISGISTRNSIISKLKETGFKNFKTEDFTKSIYRSSRYMYKMALLALMYGKIKSWVGKKYGTKIQVGNTIGAKYQYIALRKKLWEYNVIYAEKKDKTGYC